MSSSSELKELGNAAFKAAKHEEALQLFSKAIELDKQNEVLYCNRSMCHAALQNWPQSVADAKQAIALSEKYIKAHFRLVKAQLELKQFREARMNLLNAIRLCGENKEFRLLEDEVLVRTRTPLRPRPVDFEVLEELGEGNFTKVYKVLLPSSNCPIFSDCLSHILTPLFSDYLSHILVMSALLTCSLPCFQGHVEVHG